MSAAWIWLFVIAVDVIIIGAVLVGTRREAPPGPPDVVPLNAFPANLAGQPPGRLYVVDSVEPWQVIEGSILHGHPDQPVWDVLYQSGEWLICGRDGQLLARLGWEDRIGVMRAVSGLPPLVTPEPMPGVERMTGNRWW